MIDLDLVQRIAQELSIRREDAGTSRQIIGRYELGKTSPSLHQLERVAGGLGISVFQLLSGPPGQRLQMPDPDDDQWGEYEEADHDRPRGVRTETVSLRLYAKLPTDGWDEGASHEQLEVLRHVIKHEEMVIVKVHGDAMHPSLKDVDLVLVDTMRTKPKSGEVVAAVQKGKTTLKRYRVRDRERLLTPDNPYYTSVVIEEGVELRVIGVVTDLVHRDMGKARI